MINLYRHRTIAWAVNRFVFRHPRLRRALTRLVVRPRERWVDLLGARLLVHSIEEIGYDRAAAAQQAAVVLRDEVPSLLTICGLVGPTTTFVDCGANVGLFTAVVGRLHPIFPGLSLHAIEPHPETVRRLRAAVDGIATVHAVALSDRDGTIAMHPGAVSGVFSAHSGSAGLGVAPVEVPCRRLDGMPIAGDDLLLKIDVEDHESEVLAGAAGWFAAGRVAAVFVDGARDRDAVAATLRGHGFSVVDGHRLGPITTETHKLLALRAPRAEPQVDSERRSP
ncbi:MAG: FkbM family methyltransferase [Alphaproteobacteria bacterium]